LIRRRITEVELWTAEDLDLLGAARLTLNRDGSGELSFIAVEAGLDYRVGRRDGRPAIEFSFDGADEGDRINGRGWAVLEDNALHGRVFIHHGDESNFAARRATTVGALRSTRIGLLGDTPRRRRVLRTREDRRVR
jgi:hypothetical protein